MFWDDFEVFEVVFMMVVKRGSFYWFNMNVVDLDVSYLMCCRINIDKREFVFVFSVFLKSVEEEVMEMFER